MKRIFYLSVILTLSINQVFADDVLAAQFLKQIKDKNKTNIDIMIKAHYTELFTFFAMDMNNPLLKAIEDNDLYVLKIFADNKLPLFYGLFEDESPFLITNRILRKDDSGKFLIECYNIGLPFNYEAIFLGEGYKIYKRYDDFIDNLHRPNVIDYLFNHGYDVQQKVVEKADNAINFSVCNYLFSIVERYSEEKSKIIERLINSGLNVNSTMINYGIYSVKSSYDNTSGVYRKKYPLVTQLSLLDFLDLQIGSSTHYEALKKLRSYLISKGAKSVSTLASLNETQYFSSLKGKVNNEQVRVRKGPGLQYDIITKLSHEDISILYSNVDEQSEQVWHLIKTKQGMTGWMHGDYVDIYREVGYQ